MPHLAQLCTPFLDPAHRPSLYFARIGRVVAAMGLRANPLLAFLLNALLPWDFYFAYRLSRYKADLAGRVPSWLEIWFDLEALSSLANLAYLNPGYVLPAFLPAVKDGQPLFRAQSLGHPLIPAGEKVCNDFSVPELGRVAVITGSNMAGKTVFMKTVGVNLALAQAGGPVDAASLETLPFRLFTSMRIADSVTDGISYFYAEVRRLKALLAELEADQTWPLFYFIDEILRGTNNRERRLGSRAYVSALAGRRGVGLIATHDLELAGLADEVPQVRNYHFRDQVADGRMIFDYLLRPGPSPTTNALRIMQMEGLPVPEDAEGGISDSVAQGPVSGPVPAL
jgi:DNA mismatch repair ATPase MutS